MKLTISELKHIIRNIIQESIQEKRLNHSPNVIDQIIQLYIKESLYDIENSKGNCAFFAIDLYDWFKGINEYANHKHKSLQSINLTSKNKIEILYMPQDINIANNLISLGQQKDPEDHIVALINNHIVDFVFEPGQGVASQLPRNINYTQTNPLVIEYSKSLFNPNGLYGQYGYIDQNAKVEGDWITGNQIDTDIPPFVRSNTITKPNQKT